MRSMFSGESLLAVETDSASKRKFSKALRGGRDRWCIEELGLMLWWRCRLRDAWLVPWDRGFEARWELLLEL